MERRSMFDINGEQCIGCKECIRDCPKKTIYYIKGKGKINNKGCLKCGHCIAICPVEAVSTDTYSMEEVIPYDNRTFSITPDNLLNFIKFRRTMRRFQARKIEKEVICKIIEAGRFTETVGNSQDVSYIVVSEQLNLLKQLSFESLKKKGEELLANPSKEDPSLNHYASAWIGYYRKYQKDPDGFDPLLNHAPTVIFVVCDHLIDGGLASSNLELMANAMGIGVLFSGFLVEAAKASNKIRDYLKVPKGKHIVSALVMGYPDAKYYRTVPRAKAEINWL